MNLYDDDYNAALEIFQHAVVAFCDGDITRGDEFLQSLDLDAIENDRVQLREYARTAVTAKKVLGSSTVTRSISTQVKQAVRQRDRYHCRFTGRKLIDTRLFHEVSRISSVFHFDEHHSVSETRRGPAGHPIVRTHGAAYEHAMPLVCGGKSSIENIIHTSVQLNESKGATILDQIPVPNDDWNGMLDYLEGLRRQASSTTAHARNPLAERPRQSSIRNSRAERTVLPGESTTLYRKAAEGLDVVIFALRDDPDAEAAMKRFRRTNKNWFFTTKPNSGNWKAHRLYCSALDFNGVQLITSKPKVCAERRAVLEEWASRFGVTMSSCARCPKPK